MKHNIPAKARYAEKLNSNFDFMQNLTYLLFLVCLSFYGSSCQMVTCGPDKEAFLTKYSKFIDKVDRADLDASDSNWEKYDQSFKHYIEDCYDLYEDEMSTRERRQFWMKTLKYYSTRYGESMLNEFSKDAISNDVKENIEEVLDATGRDLEDFVNKNMGEIENLVRDIGKDIEDWASKMKEIFEQ
ncbi:MAG: hypothetical protein HKN76_14760 [Saprospiraceae bacterium]|nr:hypothetical protein [Saprospiraceae bacterium]